MRSWRRLEPTATRGASFTATTRRRPRANSSPTASSSGPRGIWPRRWRKCAGRSQPRQGERALRRRPGDGRARTLHRQRLPRARAVSGLADGESAQAGANRDKVSELYGDDPETAARELFTDSVFLGPARYLASQMEKVRQPAYLYFFSYVGERRRGQAPGARHGAEIPFVFDQFPAAIGLLGTAEDRRMAETVNAYWVQFAKTGDPNRAELPEWPAYTASTDRLLELGAPITVRQIG